MNPRIRAVLGAGTALAVVAGVGIGVATSSSAASQRYVTAVAATGDVTQTYTATGTISRKNTAEVSYTVSGTVKTVSVAVGDEVEAGDTLAVLSKGALRLAVLNATTTVAQAEAALYAAQHPASTSSASSGGSSGSSSASSSSGSSGASAASVVIDPTVLNEAASRMNLAVLDEADKCDAIFSTVLPEADTPTVDPAATSTATATAEPTETATAEPTATATGTATAAATESAAAQQTASDQDEAKATATATASQLANVLDSDSFTDEQLQDCANARAEVILANANLQQVVAQLTSGGGTGGGGMPSTPSKKKSSSSSSSTTTVSKAAVAKAKASLLSADQDLAAAKEDLANATLVAPISGTVGLVGLSAGDSASAGSITIVGTGSAVVSFELPLSTRELVEVGQEVTVTPAGSSRTLTGRVTSIASLETSGTSGDTPTYTTTVSVSDVSGLLASGDKASVLIPIKAETSVLRLPASAVTPTGTGTATVQVVDSASAEEASTVTVQTGAVGGGWVQITSGLEAGQIVVLADNTAAIPENQSFGRRSSSSSSSASASASAAATAVPTAEASGAASSAPTASASR
ncbi:MAG: HlyD family efflux transporter periplasmic adaptor subunit [Propionibacteriaceae bacterium]|nr:HlyD family efflux transporter periplasmic adaptor subunit [Propionibacteriaceae bacterium]